MSVDLVQLKEFVNVEVITFFTTQGNIFVTLANALVNYLIDDNTC